MHDIEPYYKWRDRYIAAEDDQSPFYGQQYDEFQYSKKIYNYFIHPQWDEFGSATLYAKILIVDYDAHYAIIEFIGEWNDCLTNDIMHLKRNVIDVMMGQGICKYLLIFENVLNFHGSDTDYYEEWYEDVSEVNGWVTMVNMLDHVETEIRETGIHNYVLLGGPFQDLNWRMIKPHTLINQIDELCGVTIRTLPSQ
ncbi:MAG: hypothetical protein DRI69_00630 [Bacteroidetes bacterium]|nr:MAG: hypothetical protein DRI69_00630 [Bacteroidota bacterium]